MIKKFSCLLAAPLLFCCAAFGGGSFESADAEMRSAVDMFALAAKTRADAAAQERNLRSLAAAAKLHLRNLEARISEAEKSLELAGGEKSEISASIERSSRELRGLSDFLDAFYAEVRASLPNGGAQISAADFSKMPVQEKLRAALGALGELKKADAKIAADKDGAVSSGLFVSGRGRSDGGVCRLKVERGAAK